MTAKSIKIITEDRDYWKKLCTKLSDKEFELEQENKRLREALINIKDEEEQNLEGYRSTIYDLACKALEQSK